MFPGHDQGPYPAVDVNELKSVRRVVTSVQAQTASDRAASGNPSFGVVLDHSLIEQHCAHPANAIAVFMRATLVDTMLEHGFLDEWLIGGELRNEVFEAAAIAPFTIEMPFDPAAFVASLQRRP